ncbi:MAG: HAMP domain-containing histidine kinase [Anaerolineae bacterium]|nr:HAMP domain-containing histidine kinase [Anaerolineae bacterium]
MSDALEQVQRLLDELLTAARSGAIIPVRLPGQIEAIQEALKQANLDTAASPVPEAPPADSFDKEAFLKDQAGFFGHSIHELRTPMTSVRGYTDMMIGMGGLSDMQKQFMEVVRTNARRMESLMQDVADMNKLRAGTLKMSPKMDMFKNIAGMTEKAMQPTADQLQRKLTFDIPAGLPLLNLDGEILARALNKLVENGLRYHEGENGECVISAAADGNTLIITVKDNGIGITSEDMEKLGSVYFRSENELVRSYKGSGLGVPIAMGIVTAMDGEIKFQSEPAQGTTATIRLKGMS